MIRSVGLRPDGFPQNLGWRICGLFLREITRYWKICPPKIVWNAMEIRCRYADGSKYRHGKLVDTCAHGKNWGGTLEGSRMSACLSAASLAAKLLKRQKGMTFRHTNELCENSSVMVHNNDSPLGKRSLEWSFVNDVHALSARYRSLLLPLASASFVQLSPTCGGQSLSIALKRSQ